MNLSILSKLLHRSTLNNLLLAGLCFFVLVSCDEDTEDEDLSDFFVQVDSVTTHRAFISWTQAVSASGKDVQYNVELDNGDDTEIYKYSDAVHLFKLQSDSAYSGVIVAYTESQAKRVPFAFQTLVDTTTFSLSLSFVRMNPTSVVLDWKLKCKEDEGIVDYSISFNDAVRLRFSDQGEGAERAGQTTINFPEYNTHYVTRITANTSKGMISSGPISFTTPGIATYSGNLTITSQDQIDNFLHTRVDGTLTINGTGITSLEGLSKLTSVRTKIEVINTSITTLRGLEYVTIVIGNHQREGRQITISDNALLEVIPVFWNLSGLGELRILRNPRLKNLDGFLYIEDIRSNIPAASQSVIVIQDNPLLENIDGLSNVENTWETDITIDNNDLLKNLSGLENASSEGFSILRITNNDLLSDFCGLRKIVTGNTFTYDVQGNLYNPTQMEIVDGPCSQ